MRSSRSQWFVFRVDCRPTGSYPQTAFEETEAGRVHRRRYGLYDSTSSPVARNLTAHPLYRAFLLNDPQSALTPLLDQAPPTEKGR